MGGSFALQKRFGLHLEVILRQKMWVKVEDLNFLANTICAQCKECSTTKTMIA